MLVVWTLREYFFFYINKNKTTEAPARATGLLLLRRLQIFFLCLEIFCIAISVAVDFCCVGPNAWFLGLCLYKTRLSVWLPGYSLRGANGLIFGRR